MKYTPLLLLAGCLLLAPTAHAEKITLAAAADLKFALDEIVTAFKITSPTAVLQVIYGSSGKFHTQIQQGAPYDLYFSADIAFVESLRQAGYAASEVKPYAIGRIVLWSTAKDASQMTLNSLTDPTIIRIAIANPKHAPYGQRAEQALRATGLWAKIESKLVYGENIAQTAQFVQTGNAQVGIIALALALSPTMASQGSYYLIPDTLHTPLQQGFIITQRAQGNALAQDFADYMSSPAARAILAQYGFILPTQPQQTE